MTVTRQQCLCKNIQHPRRDRTGIADTRAPCPNFVRVNLDDNNWDGLCPHCRDRCRIGSSPSTTEDGVEYQEDGTTRPNERP